MALSGRFRALCRAGLQSRRAGLRSRGGVIAGAWLLLWLASAVLAAQQTSTLGEVARKEEARRKKISAPAKVYTNKDLPKGAVVPPAAPGTPAAPAAGQKPAADTQKPAEPKEEEKGEAWWRKRITAVRTDLQRNEMAAEAFQSRVNALTTDFAARDDPYQRAQISIERQKTLNELARVKEEIVRLRKVIADIEEEARVAGVPPGWLR